jgi:CheY-like chemotaxis protein
MILCIDDEASGLQVRKMLLQSEGHQVLTALNGPEGLALFAVNPIKVVVLDYMMPGMNGGEVAAVMKRLKPKVKILIYSAYIDLSEDAVRWADNYVVKGTAPEALLGALQQLLSCAKSASAAS